MLSAVSTRIGGHNKRQGMQTVLVAEIPSFQYILLASTDRPLPTLRQAKIATSAPITLTTERWRPKTWGVIEQAGATSTRRIYLR